MNLHYSNDNASFLYDVVEGSVEVGIATVALIIHYTGAKKMEQMNFIHF